MKFQPASLYIIAESFDLVPAAEFLSKMSAAPSYADIAAKGPKQTPEEAAAPQPPQVESSTTASTSSLVDVDTPSVRTVPSDFGDQDVQTGTQADRIEREHEAAAEAEAKKKKARSARERAAARARSADNWLAAKMESLGDGPATALFAGNLAVVMGLGAVMGYKAWGLYERRALGWKGISLGLGLLGIVGLGEGVFTRAYYRAKAKAKGKKQ